MERCKVMLAMRTSKERCNLEMKWPADQRWRAEMPIQLEPLQAFMGQGQTSTSVLTLQGNLSPKTNEPLTLAFMLTEKACGYKGHSYTGGMGNTHLVPWTRPTPLLAHW